MKVLLAGPYIGEFGWELFCWQAFIRKLSREYDNTIVIGRPLNEMLYKDFCDEYVSFDPESFETDAYRCSNAKDPSYIIESIPHTHYISGQFDIGMHYHGKVIDTKGWFFNRQEFIKYVSDTDNRSYDVIFHCRNKKTGDERNWSIDKWGSLRHLLPSSISIGCIGNNEAYHIEGTDDLRDINLEDLVSILGNSKLIVGPSSGPMHLASLCGLKHLVWTDNFNINRYRRDWNPHNTEHILYTASGWDPDPSVIKNLIVDNIR